MKNIYLVLGLVVVVGAATYAYNAQVQKTQMEPDGVYCTQEAKLCPDGSYVGRTGPNCEFTKCPDVVVVPPPPSAKSGVRGTVTLGPTCPVQQYPPDPACRPKPYSTSIFIRKAGSTEVFKTISSDSNGQFSAELVAGKYVLQTPGGNIMPRCEEVTVEVKSGQYTKADISCDTGIR